MEVNRDLDTRRLGWPGADLPAVLGKDGWVHAELNAQLDFGLQPTPGEGWPSESIGAIAVRGERLAAMRAIEQKLSGEIAMAYLDVPRLEHASFAHPHLRIGTWLSMVQGAVSGVVPLLSDGGRVVVHVDDEGAAFAAAMLDDLLGAERRVDTIVWQKKYSPQNDLKGRVDDAQDYLLVYGEGTPRGDDIEKRFWPWEYGGKSEDATRESNRLLGEGVVTLSPIPKTAKPQKLMNRLLAAYTKVDDLVLEVFSDTAFLSAAAIGANRKPVLLAGGRERELSRFETCGLPRIRHLLDGEREASVHSVEGSGAKERSVSSKGNPIRYGQPTSAEEGDRELRSIILEPNPGTQGRREANGFPSATVDGPPREVIRALEPAVSCTVDLARVDVRDMDLEGADKAVGELRGRLKGLAGLLSDGGVVSIAADRKSFAAARLTGEMDVFGRSQYLGSLAVEERTPEESEKSPDWYVEILFKILPDAWGGPIGLPASRDYTDDGDPRGPWRATGHKGARRGNENTAFHYRLPPYRWELVSGELPPGAWRINPVSGVIFAPELEEPGTYEFVVRVKDHAGRSGQATCKISVKSAGSTQNHESVWWLGVDELEKDAEGPEVVSTTLPDGVVGERYHVVLRARGGDPTDGLTAPGESTEENEWSRTRYWEFSFDSLVRYILEDRAHFGATGTARPSRKIYQDEETAKTIVELSWWDASRLDGESPLKRLVRLFTSRGDLVFLEPGERETFAAVRDLGRRCLSVSEGRGEEPEVDYRGRMGPVVARLDANGRVFRPEYEIEDFDAALAWVLGFLPIRSVRHRIPDGLSDEVVSRITGISADGEEALVVFRSDEWPRLSACEMISDQLAPSYQGVSVLYYRGSPPKRLPGLSYRRIPFDLGSG